MTTDVMEALEKAIVVELDEFNAELVIGYRVDTAKAVATKRIMEVVRAALSEHEGWRPIKSAPKDGTRVMFWNGDSMSVGGWSDDEFEAHPEPRFNLDGCYGQQPTHWRPLPSPPKAEI